MMDDDEYDMERVIDLSVTFGIVLLVLGLVTWGFVRIHENNALAPYVTICQNNAKERYAQTCTTATDCVQQCAQRLRTQGGVSPSSSVTPKNVSKS
jgi:hypothetical protein